METENLSWSMRLLLIGLLKWLSGQRNPPAKAGDAGTLGSIPGLGRSPGGGNGNPLQYSCLENSMDRGAWRATAHGVKKTRDDRETKHPCVRLLLHRVVLTVVYLHVCVRGGEQEAETERQDDAHITQPSEH